MKSPVVKRSIVIAGHKTSVSLEDPFWSALKEIAARRLVQTSSSRASRCPTRRCILFLEPAATVCGEPGAHKLDHIGDGGAVREH
jgi:hypothetical protein